MVLYQLDFPQYKSFNLTTYKLKIYKHFTQNNNSHPN